MSDNTSLPRVDNNLPSSIAFTHVNSIVILTLPTPCRQALYPKASLYASIQHGELKLPDPVSTTTLSATSLYACMQHGNLEIETFR